VTGFHEWESPIPYGMDGSYAGPIVITRNDKAVAVLIASTNDEDLETLLLARLPWLQATLN
jgi:PHD/YefM family antitoxin component YafN of YafNO toxin-antitoxin module